MRDDETEARRAEPALPPEHGGGDRPDVLDEIGDLWTVDVEGVEMAVRFRP